MSSPAANPDEVILPYMYAQSLIVFSWEGYSDYQVYLMLSCAPIQGHIAGLVDIPNACTTLGLPMDIFDFDISPTATAQKKDMGNCAFAST